MKNVLLFQVNSLIAYVTVNLILGFAVAKFLLNVQSKINQFFDYDWSAAVKENKSR